MVDLLAGGITFCGDPLGSPCKKRTIGGFVMSEVKRYDSYLRDGVVHFEADPEGAWMPSDDVQSELAALREELAETQQISQQEELRANEYATQLVAAEQRNEELEALLDTPHTSDWFEGVKLEAGHQIKRWGSEHDAGKGPADWFWLIGYLAQKAMGAQMLGDTEKAKHHTISTGAALLNWFRAITGDSNAMRPGIDDATLKPTESGASE